MHEQTLLVLAGGALLLWWMSQGAAQTKTLEDSTLLMKNISAQFIDAGIVEDSDKSSWVAFYMNDIQLHIESIVERTVDGVAGLTKIELIDIVRLDIKQASEQTHKLEKNLPNIQAQIDTYGVYKDGPLNITQGLMDKANAYVRLGNRLFAGTLRVLFELYRRLPEEDDTTARQLIAEAKVFTPTELDAM
jgi:hypothetical protein